MKIDFLAIGDTMVDAFIKLKDAHVHCNIDKEGCELCLSFGDKIPYEFVTVIPAVGNSANASVCAAKLGLSTALITNIGKDIDGKECINSLKKNGVKTKYVKKQKNKKTNYHYVLWYEVDRTILIKHTPFEYVLPKIKDKVSWIYLSSLAENTLAYHTEILEYLKKHPETKLAFQPGTFQIKFGVENLKEIYERTEIFFSNLEEAQRILDTEEKDVLKLSQGLHSLGPKIVVISDGPNGAYMYLNNELWQMPIYRDIAPPIDRTGAGDAFSATITSALALGKDPLEALTWGPINSMSVVQKVGAQDGLLSLEKVLKYKEVAPSNYNINKIRGTSYVKQYDK